jgi:hypothetical protein
MRPLSERDPASWGANARPWMVVGVSAFVLLSVRFDIVPLLRGPAPYPPEWQWRHRPRALSRALPAVPVGLALAGLLVWSGTAAARRRPRRSAAIVIAGGLVVGGAFPLALVHSEDGGAVAHLVRRTASPGYLSYHAVASSETASDMRRFLQEYPAIVRDLPVHAATHPPGPVVLFRGLIRLFERSPPLRDAVDRQVLRACGREAESCGPHLAAVVSASRAAALAGPLLAHVVAMATLLPIAWLAFQLTRDPLASARTAALWPLVPGAALFMPALDPAIAFPITVSLAGLRAGWCAERSWARAAGVFVAAASGAAAVYLSYGSALFLILGTAVVAASLPDSVRRRGPRQLAVPLAGVAVIGTAFVFLPLAIGHDPLASARAALAVHAAEFTAQRSYTLWLVFGPLDLALFLGVPVALAFAAHLAGAFGPRGLPSWTPPTRWALATMAVLALLFASGLVRGEVGRLFVPLMPLGLLAGALRLEEEPGPDSRTAAVLAMLLGALDVVMRLNWRI